MPSWYDPKMHKGRMIYGAAAMNARVKIAGGQDKLVKDIAEYALSRARSEQIDAEAPRQVIRRTPRPVTQPNVVRRRAAFD